MSCVYCETYDTAFSRTISEYNSQLSGPFFDKRKRNALPSKYDSIEGYQSVEA